VNNFARLTPDQQSKKGALWWVWEIEPLIEMATMVCNIWVHYIIQGREKHWEFPILRQYWSLELAGEERTFLEVMHCIATIIWAFHILFKKKRSFFLDVL
jgi:hypothetical protein